MKRLLGRMHVENETVEVNEIHLDALERQNAVQVLGAMCERYDQSAVAEWAATIEEKVVGYGMLELVAPQQVLVHVIVGASHRGLGIGKFMFRFATDLAIRHRQTVLFIHPLPSDAVTPILADREDFEPDQEVAGRFRKVLKWQ